MKDFFKELFLYNNDVNQKLIKVFESNPDKISEKALKLLSHILNAHQIWNHRIDPQEKISSVWQIHSPDKLKEIDQHNYNKTKIILEKIDLIKTYEYTNSAGQKFTNSVKDILFHVINHSTYHRAQIASDFKESGIEPIVSDYIFYKR
jgi:uncharacterized damage-inducible protein DinB